MEQTGLFDSHAHYDDPQFDDCREELLDSLFSSGAVSGILNAASDLASSERSLRLAERYDGMYAAVGIHPHEAEEADASARERLASLFAHPKAVAIGEIGLDYHYGADRKEIQKRALEMQLELAQTLGAPVIIHDREAHGDVMETLRRFPDVYGVLHSFSGSAEMARELVALGWYLSFSGTLTFKNAEKPLLAAAAVPDDRILIETDCPYLAPHPMRGKRNHSGYLIYTAEKLAQLRNMTTEEAVALTAANTRRLFQIL